MKTLSEIKVYGNYVDAKLPNGNIITLEYRHNGYRVSEILHLYSVKLNRRVASWSAWGVKTYKKEMNALNNYYFKGEIK